MLVGGSALAAVGTISRWSTGAIIAIVAIAAVVAVGAALEGAYRLRFQAPRPDIRIRRGRQAASMVPLDLGNVAIDVGLHHAEIANRGDQPVHLEFTPRCFWPAAGEAPEKSAVRPIPISWFEDELQRQRESAIAFIGAFLGSRVRVEPQSFVEGFLVWGWMEDKSVLDAEVQNPRNVWSVDVTDLISGVTWTDIPFEFSSRGTRSHAGLMGQSAA